MNAKSSLLFWLLALKVLNVSPAQSIKTWTGPSGSDWFTPGNWTPAGVPAVDDTVNFTNGTIHISTPVTVAGQFNWTAGTLQGSPLTIASNGVLNLAAGPGTLFLDGSLTNAGTVNWVSGDLK